MSGRCADVEERPQLDTAAADVKRLGGTETSGARPLGRSVAPLGAPKGGSGSGERMLTEWLTLGSVLTVDGLRHRSDRRRIVPSRDGAGWTPDPSGTFWSLALATLLQLSRGCKSSADDLKRGGTGG